MKLQFDHGLRVCLRHRMMMHFAACTLCVELVRDEESAAAGGRG